MAAPLRWKTLINLSLVAGTIETLLIHSAYRVCYCRMNGDDATNTFVQTVVTFLSYMVHLVPVSLIECLIVLKLFGPEIFDLGFFSTTSPIWVWGALLLLIIVFTWFFKLRPIHNELIQQNEQSGDRLKLLNGWQEGHFCHDQNNEQQSPLALIEQDYGSFQQIKLIITPNQKDDVSSELSVPSSLGETVKSDENSSEQCFKKCIKALCQYWEGLRVPIDVLVVSFMTMLLWQCSPVLKVLGPLAKSSLGLLATWVSTPVLIAAFLFVATVVHFLFVQ